MNLLLNKYKPTTIDEINLNLHTKQLLKKLITINELHLLIVGSITSGKSSLINIILNDISLKIDKDNILYINLLKDQGLNYYKNNLKNFCDTVDLINTIAMNVGLRFAIREGGRTVGAGQVTEILE